MSLSMSWGLEPDTGKLRRFSSALRSLTFMSSSRPTKRDEDGASVEEVVELTEGDGEGWWLAILLDDASLVFFCEAGRIICGYLCWSCSWNCRSSVCCCRRRSYELSPLLPEFEGELF